MRAAYIIMVSIVCAVLAAPVLAQDKQSQGGGQGGGSLGAPSDAVYLDPAPFIQEVDTDKDGNVSKAEWLAVGLPDNLYSRFDKQNKGYISKEVMAAMYHPPSMDSDKSGKFTLAKLRAHIASQQSSGNNGQTTKDGRPNK